MVICGWTLSSVIGLLVIFGMTKYADPAVEINDGVRVSYGALHRIAWATSVAWIVFSCVRGYGGNRHTANKSNIYYIIIKSYYLRNNINVF